MNYSVLNVFSLADSSGGNPCAIFDLESSIDTMKMQAIAKALKLPETVFISNDSGMDILRFFATKGELPLCCHGSLGAGYFLAEKRGAQGSFIVKTAGGVDISLAIENDLVSMKIPLGSILTPSFDRHEAARLLNIPVACISPGMPCVIASVGSPKLLIPIVDRETLFRIVPDNGLLIEWSHQNSMNGFYLYSDDTVGGDSDFIARNFNPRFSDAEDVATGVSAAALCQALKLLDITDKDSLIIEQGYSLGSPSEIFIVFKDDKISIEGRVVWAECSFYSQ